MSRDGLPTGENTAPGRRDVADPHPANEKNYDRRKGRVGYGRRAMISALTAASTMAKLRQGPAMSKTTASIRATGS